MNDWYVWFLLIIALIFFALTEYAIRRDRREFNDLSRYNGGYKREKAGRGYARAVLKLYEEMEG